jgi:hypothetical protein
MNADLMTTLLLNPFLTFGEVEREVAAMRVMTNREPPAAGRTRLARRGVVAAPAPSVLVACCAECANGGRSSATRRRP